MPRRTDHPPQRIELLPLEQRRALLAGRCQENWYRFLAMRVLGATVLDVGAGDGYGSEILRLTARRVVAVDPAPSGPNVLGVDVSSFASQSFDVAVALDVIEHVGWADEDAERFLSHLLRVARRWAFISTPNYDWLHARLQNPHHAREYTAAELLALIGGRPHDAWCVDGRGSEIRQCDLRAPGDPVLVSGFGVMVHVEEGA